MLKSQEFDWISCIGTGSFSKVYFATAATRATKEYAVKIIDKSEVIKLNIHWASLSHLTGSLRCDN